MNRDRDFPLNGEKLHMRSPGSPSWSPAGHDWYGCPDRLAIPIYSAECCSEFSSEIFEDLNRAFDEAFEETG